MVNNFVKHSYIHRNSFIHTFIHTYIHITKYACIHTYPYIIQADRQTNMNICMHACMHKFGRIAHWQTTYLELLGSWFKSHWAFATQPHNKSSNDPQVKLQRLSEGEWGCSLESGQKFAMEQQRMKKKETYIHAHKKWLVGKCLKISAIKESFFPDERTSYRTTTINEI